ncbi:hypothetical protein CGRA01v4_04090 [Colletotrichum graminicola]|uniref:Zygote-specific protein n=1 Tax=Colletotrichum graminicola (strain M1.001 / M2 / FGSC 10212) TaxID=645133 RepID=E3QXL3_COLGM|nr:uncharacterized protein GLRG_10745 [Colletotrichum graminicola M1.001]EFQ35601.1 hypothetical protein GLRG_10745 [Colletotrichum graminicola M1.001]WDK12809.1 hypothetical protein CGRA01v4_04090 [Colletotrichum graminicola]
MTPARSFTLLVIFSLPCVLAGPAAYGVCQRGCSSVVMACYKAAGSTWGATLGLTATPLVIGCNSAYGTCQAACAAVVFTLTP